MPCRCYLLNSKQGLLLPGDLQFVVAGMRPPGWRNGRLMSDIGAFTKECVGLVEKYRSILWFLPGRKPLPGSFPFRLYTLRRRGKDRSCIRRYPYSCRGEMQLTFCRFRGVRKTVICNRVLTVCPNRSCLIRCCHVLSNLLFPQTLHGVGSKYHVFPVEQGSNQFGRESLAKIGLLKLPVIKYST